MTIRSKRRPATGTSFETMSDVQLAEIYHFGNLAVDPSSITFIATPEQQLRAGALLRERRNEREEKQTKGTQ